MSLHVDNFILILSHQWWGKKLNNNDENGFKLEATPTITWYIESIVSVALLSTTYLHKTWLLLINFGYAWKMLNARQRIKCTSHQLALYRYEIVLYTTSKFTSFLSLSLHFLENAQFLNWFQNVDESKNHLWCTIFFYLKHSKSIH